MSWLGQLGIDWFEVCVLVRRVIHELPCVGKWCMTQFVYWSSKEKKNIIFDVLGIVFIYSLCSLNKVTWHLDCLSYVADFNSYPPNLLFLFHVLICRVFKTHFVGCGSGSYAAYFFFILQEWVANFEKPKGDPSAFVKPATTVLSPYLKVSHKHNGLYQLVISRVKNRIVIGY